MGLKYQLPELVAVDRACNLKEEEINPQWKIRQHCSKKYNIA
jgi:hypothetical protein